MPKKQKNTKKAKEQVILVPTSSAQELTSNAEKIAALMALQATQGWALILQVLVENKEYLERLIISAIDPETGLKLEPAAQDEARYKLKLVEELMNTPAGYIEALKQADGGPVEFDPYAKSTSDMISARK